VTHILVVEDENDILSTLEMVLQMEGFDVSTATNGKLALEKMRERKPVLLISDIMMPVMNGLELLKQLRSDPDFSALPVIIISAGRPDPSYPQTWNDFLSKPLDLDKLLETIRKYLKP
jgi:CheY-like chemotaxis protein